MKKLITVVFLFLLLQSNTINASTAITWHSMSELINNGSKTNKTILVLVSTGKSDNGLLPHELKNEAITQYISENYYTVKFDAHDRTSYTVNGRTYDYSSDLGNHSLANLWTQGHLMADRFVFLNNNLNLLYGIDGNHDEENFLKVLHYFNGPYLSIRWRDFNYGSGQKLTDNLPIIIKAYENDFKSIKGKLMKHKAYSMDNNSDDYHYHYESSVKVPKAIESHIVFDGVTNEHNHPYFQAVLANNLDYNSGRSELQKWGNEVATCDLITALDAERINRSVVNYNGNTAILFSPINPSSEHEDAAILIELQKNAGNGYALVLTIGQNKVEEGRIPPGFAKKGGQN